MAIPKKRFQFLDGENVLRQTSFLDANTNEVLNIIGLDDLPAGLSAFIEAGLQQLGLGDLIGTGVSETIAQATRLGKSVSEAISDLTNLGPEDINAMLSLLTNGDQQLNSTLGRLPQSYLDNLLNTVGTTVGLDNVDTESIKLITNAVSKLSNSNFNSGVISKTQGLTTLTALTNIASQLGVTGVFNTLKTGLDLEVVAKAGMNVLTNMSSRGDTQGIIEIANQMSGLGLSLQTPNIAERLIQAFLIPKELVQNEYGLFVNNFNASMQTVTPKWNVSSFDGIQSVGLMQKFNPGGSFGPFTNTPSVNVSPIAPSSGFKMDSFGFIVEDNPFNDGFGPFLDPSRNMVDNKYGNVSQSGVFGIPAPTIVTATASKQTASPISNAVSTSPRYATAVKALVMNNVFTMEQLDQIPVGDEAFILAALAANIDV